tara:strand:- start:306 stop:443 length:138 start_codon:yes stop_codon:yes gene_type:complete
VVAEVVVQLDQFRILEVVEQADIENLNVMLYQVLGQHLQQQQHNH